MASNPRQITSADLFFFFHAPINHLSFYCIKQIDYIFPCVYCNRSQKTSQRVKNNSHATRSFLFFTRCDVICDLLQYTHTEKCNIFVKQIASGVANFGRFRILVNVNDSPTKVQGHFLRNAFCNLGARI